MVLELIRGGGGDVTVDAELLEILVCPNDRGELDYLEEQQVIVCRTCGYRYPVRDDIPVMLIDEAEKPGEARRQAVTDLDDPQALRLADPQGMLDAVLGMPNDCRAAYDSARLAEGLPSPQDVTSVTFCGMGGSAVSGDVVRSVFVERLGVPVEVNRSPVLPEHCGSAHAGGGLVVLREHGGDARIVPFGAANGAAACWW